MRRGPAALRRDVLLRNSVFIAMSNASMGALGFLFWVLATRLFPAEQIGLASTLVSAAILIGYASLLGFNTTFVRYLPLSDSRDEEINTGLVLVFLAALVIGGAYVSIVPAFVPRLEFLHTHPFEAAAIVVFVAFGSVNVVTDSVFIAYRSAGYNLLVDGLLQGSVRLVMPVFVVGLGAFGLFSAFGSASIAAVLASVVLMMRRFSYRPRISISMDVLRRVFRFGAANYVAEMLTMLPVLVLPLVVVEQLGAADAGYYYLATTIANLLYAASLAVGQSLFAEGANRSADLRSLAMRAGRLQLYMLVPTAVLVVIARPLLSLFGPGYARGATTTLMVLVAAAPAVGIKHWMAAVLRLRHKLGWLVAANACVALIPCLLGAVWAARGIAWVAAAWLIGNVAAAAVAATSLWLSPKSRAKREQPAVAPPAELADA